MWKWKIFFHFNFNSLLISSHGMNWKLDNFNFTLLDAYKLAILEPLWRADIILATAHKVKNV